MKVVVRLCQTHTYKSQSILIHIAPRPPALLEPSGNHFFLLSLSFQVAATVIEALCSLKIHSRPSIESFFSLTYFHHHCVNRPFLIRRHTHCRFKKRLFATFLFSLFLFLCYCSRVNLT